LSRNIFGLPFFYIYAIYKSWKGVINKNTYAVIEGMPRSANTYTIALLKVFYPNIKLAHHMHGILQFKVASIFKKRMICLIREPKDIVESLLIRQEGINPKNILREYIKFYTYILHKKSIKIIYYSEIIKNPNIIFKALDLEIPIYPSNLENLIRIKIEDMEKMDSNSNQVNNYKVGYPTKERELLKKKLTFEIWNKYNINLLRECDELFSEALKRSYL